MTGLRRTYCTLPYPTSDVRQAPFWQGFNLHGRIASFLFELLDLFPQCLIFLEGVSSCCSVKSHFEHDKRTSRAFLNESLAALTFCERKATRSGPISGSRTISSIREDSSISLSNGGGNRSNNTQALRHQLAGVGYHMTAASRFAIVST